MVTVIYFGIPLILLLALLMAGVLLLRPRGWRPGARWSAWPAGGVLRPRVPARRLAVRDGRGRRWGSSGAWPRPACGPADLLTYLDAGPENRFSGSSDSGTHPAMFPGFTVYALVAAAFALAPRRARPPAADGAARGPGGWSAGASS